MPFSYSDITTIITPAGTITCNADTGDTLFIDPTQSTGLGTSAVRAPTDNRGQTDGYNLHDFFEEGQHIVLAGQVVIRSAATDAAVVSARNAILASTQSKLKSLLRATGTLNFTGGGSVTVKCDLLINPSGAFQKGFVFALVSADPA